MTWEPSPAGFSGGRPTEGLDSAPRWGRGRKAGARGALVVRAAGRVITAALVVVPGPGETVTFIRQERGPYAGWWLLPGGKVEFGEPVEQAALVCVVN